VNKQRIKHNAATTAANIAYYGGTISAGLGFYHLLDNRNPLAITALVVFVLTVEGLLRTLLDELLNVSPTGQDTNATTAAVPAKTEEAAR
jgi:hypothetical protein